MSKQEERFARRRLRNSYISTTISITLVLYMLGLTGSIVLFAREIAVKVKEHYSFTIFMADQTPETEILRFQKYLDTREAVKTTRFKSSAEASEEYSREIGEDFVEMLGKSPISDQILLTIKAEYANADSLKPLEDDILSRPMVAEFHYNKGLIDQVNHNMHKFGMVLLAFSILLFVIAFALINNTIRLAVFANRFIIRSMQMVGATQRFIRRPFLRKGLVQGMVSALLSILMLIGTFHLFNREVDPIVTLDHLDLLLVLFAFVLLLGVLLVRITTWLAVRRYLRLKTDQLYQY
jgi:cell division transport system permease protein